MERAVEGGRDPPPVLFWSLDLWSSLPPSTPAWSLVVGLAMGRRKQRRSCQATSTYGLRASWAKGQPKTLEVWARKRINFVNTIAQIKLSFYFVREVYGVFHLKGVKRNRINLLRSWQKKCLYPFQNSHLLNYVINGGRTLNTWSSSYVAWFATRRSMATSLQLQNGWWYITKKYALLLPQSPPLGGLWGRKGENSLKITSSCLRGNPWQCVGLYRQ